MSLERDRRDLESKIKSRDGHLKQAMGLREEIAALNKKIDGWEGKAAKDAKDILDLRAKVEKGEKKEAREQARAALKQQTR
ncbi:hypothetical protein [Actinokineospora pegani]|uniref:hypothetical protein n=1 Tax=Actinokineospora pegani TaxID=2654637 RepID=UPI0012EAE666|nr:hypothetical protein [Actinokineospora pegani]